MAKLRADPVWVEKQKNYQRGYALARRYGITTADYCAAELAQNGRCAICGVDGVEDFMLTIRMRLEIFAGFFAVNATPRLGS